MAVGTTRGKRRLGRYVRPFVDRSGLKIEEIASRVRCSRQTVSRLLSGDHLPRFHVLATILGVLQVTEDERARAIELWEIADASTAKVEHASQLPVAYARFRLDEWDATRERTLDTVMIPGMLQTPEYAAAIADAQRPLIHGEWDQAAAEAERRDRQALLTREDAPLTLHALIDEAAIRRVVGGRDVWAAQLDHLVAATDSPNVTVQVIPYCAGAYGGMAGPLIILSYPEDDEPDSVHLETVTGMSTVENETDVTALCTVWDTIADSALSAHESVKLIGKVRREH